MKNLKFQLIVLVVLLFLGKVSAQDSELKINVPLSLAGFLEGSYERILTDESSVGISIGYAYEDSFYFDGAAAIPYYRFFFGKKRAAGFFVEGNGAIYSQEYEEFEMLTSQVSTESDLGIGLGLAIGFKLKTNNDWVFEIFAGAGRNFNDENIESGYPRIGLNLGKRF